LLKIINDCKNIEQNEIELSIEPLKESLSKINERFSNFEQQVKIII
jgi:hypothetical protein